MIKNALIFFGSGLVGILLPLPVCFIYGVEISGLLPVLSASLLGLYGLLMGAVFIVKAESQKGKSNAK